MRTFDYGKIRSIGSPPGARSSSGSFSSARQGGGGQAPTPICSGCAIARSADSVGASARLRAFAGGRRARAGFARGRWSLRATSKVSFTAMRAVASHRAGRRGSPRRTTRPTANDTRGSVSAAARRHVSAAAACSRERCASKLEQGPCEHARMRSPHTRDLFYARLRREEPLQEARIMRR